MRLYGVCQKWGKNKKNNIHAASDTFTIAVYEYTLHFTVEFSNERRLLGTVCRRL